MDTQDPNQPRREDAVNEDTDRPQGEDTPDVGGDEAQGPVADETSQADGEKEAEQPPYRPEQKPVNFNEELPTTQGLAEGKAGDLTQALALFREAYSHVAEVMERQSELLKRLNDREEKTHQRARAQNRQVGEDEGSPWFRTAMNALTEAQVNGMGERSMTREESEWLQILEHEGLKLRAGQPRQNLTKSANSPQEAILALSRQAGVGTVFDVPLYHSGIWLRLKTPPLSALTSLQYQLGQLKISLGSDSKGMAFSNTSQRLTSMAVDFALQYVIDANIHYTSGSDLKEYIKLPDAPVLLWALATTLYPQGYPYAHPCVADPQNCQHVVHETLNLNRLFWTDSTALSKTQRKLMARRFGAKLSTDDYALYQNEHVRGSDRLVWFEDINIGLELQVPNLQEYEESGHAWIQGIIDMTQGAFNEAPHGTNRNLYISNLGMATTARQHAHWIKRIHTRDEDGVEQEFSDDIEVINEALNLVFSAEEHVDRFFEKTTEYMDDSLISLVAIPSFNCPECKSPAAMHFHERFPHLVPLDVVSTFFTLVSRKLS